MLLVRRLSVTPYTTCLFLTHIYGLFCAHIYARLYHKVRKNASMRDKKTHVYRVAGMIASTRGKKPQVYRVIISKQMADHMIRVISDHRSKSTQRNASFLDSLGVVFSRNSLKRSRSNWNLEVLVFEEREKPEYPEKNL